MPAAADVIHFSAARRANEFYKCFDQVEAVNVITNLFALVSKDAVRPATDGTNHQIGQKTVQLRSCVCRSSKAAAAKRDRRHTKITSIFLNQKIGCGFGCPEERVLAVVDAHRF